MASSGDIWWKMHVHAAATVGMAINAGASGMACLNTIAANLHPLVPAKSQAQQTSRFLHISEMIFPPANICCSIAQLVVFIAYCIRNGDGFSEEKRPCITAAFACGLGVAMVSACIMVPLDRRLKGCDVQMQNGDDEKAGEEFEGLLRKWLILNYGELTMFIYSC